MRMFAGLDVGFKRTLVCIVDQDVKLVKISANIPAAVPRGLHQVHDHGPHRRSLLSGKDALTRARSPDPRRHALTIDITGLLNRRHRIALPCRMCR